MLGTHYLEFPECDEIMVVVDNSQTFSSVTINTTVHILKPYDVAYKGSYFVSNTSRKQAGAGIMINPYFSGTRPNHFIGVWDVYDFDGNGLNNTGGCDCKADFYYR